jgi:hypothetical protein
MEPSKFKMGTVILWILAILGTWSFLKDFVPAVLNAAGRWQARYSVSAAEHQALNLVVAIDKLADLRDAQELRIYGIIQDSKMFLVVVLAVTLIGIGLFEPEQKKVGSLGGLFLAMVAATFFMTTYFRMNDLKNFDIEVELVRARLGELTAWYPKDDTLQRVQKVFDQIHPRSTTLPRDPSSLRELKQGFSLVE